MSKRVRNWLSAIAFGGVLLLAVAAGWRLAESRTQSTPAPAAMPIVKELSDEKRQVHLFFSDSQGRFLNSEPRMIRKTSDQILYGRLLVQELIRGSQTGRGRTLPADAIVRAFFLLDDGQAIIDFDEKAFNGHPRGVATELMSIYSVVNTLLLNSDVIRSVKFLIDGREAATLAGHVDLSRPYTANLLLIR